MSKAPTLAAFVVGMALCGAARAEDVCTVPMANWHPRNAVQEMALAQGWTVRRIKTDDGCYEVRGSDAQGRGIEVKIDPGTLAIVRLEYEDDDSGEGAEQDHPGTHGQSSGASEQKTDE